MPAFCLRIEERTGFYLPKPEMPEIRIGQTLPSISGMLASLEFF
jgi:hypothetical protein